MIAAGSHKALGRRRHSLGSGPAAAGSRSLADSPWSVPRLRGRGDQGVIVMPRPHFVRAQLRSLSRHTPKSAVKRGASPTVSLAHHGLASEATLYGLSLILTHMLGRGAATESDRLP
jgi:hypothetical protein